MTFGTICVYILGGKINTLVLQWFFSVWLCMNSFYNSGKNALVFMFGDSYWWKTVLEFIVFYKIIGKKKSEYK